MNTPPTGTRFKFVSGKPELQLFGLCSVIGTVESVLKGVKSKEPENRTRVVFDFDNGKVKSSVKLSYYNEHAMENFDSDDTRPLERM